MTANIDPGEFVKTPPSTLGRREQGWTNAFPINIQPGARAYRYEVDMNCIVQRGQHQSQRSLMKPASDDGRKASLSRACYHILGLAYETSECFGMDEDGELVYDNRRILFTSQELPIEADQAEVCVPSEEISPEILSEIGACAFVHVVIKPNGTLDLTDLDQYRVEATLRKEDRSLRLFLELLTSQLAIQENIYSPIGGSGKLFMKDPDTFRKVENGMILRPGLSKGVRIIEDDGRSIPAMVVDVKTSAFYAPQNLATTVREMCHGVVPPVGSPQWERVLHMLRDVRVRVIHQPSRTFTIRGFTSQAVSQITFQTNDGIETNMVNYYATRLEVRLNHRDAPAVIPDMSTPAGMKTKPRYPLEVLAIVPDQRVPLGKMTEQLSSTLLKENSILPAERHDQVVEQCERYLKVFGNDNPIMQSFGVTISGHANSDVMKVRDLPAIQYANEQVNVDAAEATWRPSRHSRYLATMGEPIKWVVLCSTRNSRDVRSFIAKYLDMARGKGMTFLDPIFIDTFNSQRPEFANLFPRLFKEEVHFAMLVDPRDVPSHDPLKYHDQHDQVITQHVTLEKARDVVLKKQTQTLLNIINKSNMKLFGQNYRPDMQHLPDHYMLENGVFVIGYDVNHPSPISKHEMARLRRQGVDVIAFDPSVVGICANSAANPNTFVGDYFFQPARHEKLDEECLSLKVAEALSQLEQLRPQHKAPELIVVVRDGVSEGQFKMVVERELPAILDGCDRYQPGYRPDIVFVVSTKRHDKRFFREVNGRLENPLPGTVVDEGVVRPDVDEFFMQAHKPLQGTSKWVQFTTLVNDPQMSKDDLEELLLGLCFNHQIVHRSVAVPEPVYQAHELAKRGRNNLRELKSTSPDDVPRMPEGLVDAAALNHILPYKGSWMAPTRFTA